MQNSNCSEVFQLEKVADEGMPFLYILLYFAKIIAILIRNKKMDRTLNQILNYWIMRNNYNHYYVFAISCNLLIRPYASVYSHGRYQLHVPFLSTHCQR